MGFGENVQMRVWTRRTMKEREILVFLPVCENVGASSLHGVEPMVWWIAFRLNVEGQISSLVGSMMLFGGFV